MMMPISEGQRAAQLVAGTWNTPLSHAMLAYCQTYLQFVPTITLA